MARLPLRARLLTTLTALVVAALLATALPGGPAGADDGGPGADRPAYRGIDTIHPRGNVPSDDDFPTLPRRCYLDDEGRLKTGPCHITDYDPALPSVVLWGDSHAWQYQPALEAAVAGRPVNLTAFIQGGCPPAIAPPNRPGAYYTKCEHNDRLAVDYIRRLARRGTVLKLVLGSHWGGYRQAYRRIFLDQFLPGASGFSTFTAHMIELAHKGTEPLFEELGRLGVHTDVIGQAATVPNAAPPCPAGQEPYQCTLPRWRAIKQEGDTRRYLQRLQAHLTTPTRLIDATPTYCDALLCQPQVDGVNTFWDQLHLGKALTSTMGSYFVPSVKDAVRLSRADAKGSGSSAPSKSAGAGSGDRGARARQFTSVS